MRKPTVKNKHNLTVPMISKLEVVDRAKLCSPLFWRNDVVNAWCISGSTAKTAKEDEFGTYSSYWIGIYDEDAKAYAGKIRVDVSCHGDMCSYKFKNFFKEKDIENELDLRIQELLLEKVNQLIDDGILALPADSDK